MKLWEDSTGRKWELSINVLSARKLKTAHDVNLFEIEDGEFITKLSKDVFLLSDILYTLSKTQADAAGIDTEKFGEALDGKAIDNATEAFLEELCDFSPH